MEVPYTGPPLEWLTADPQRWEAYVDGYASGYAPGVTAGGREIDRNQLHNAAIDVERAYAQADAATPVTATADDGVRVGDSPDLWPTFLAGHGRGWVDGLDQGREEAAEGWEEVREAAGPLAHAAQWPVPTRDDWSTPGLTGEQVRRQAEQSWTGLDQDDAAGYG